METRGTRVNFDLGGGRHSWNAACSPPLPLPSDAKHRLSNPHQFSRFSRGTNSGGRGRRRVDRVLSAIGTPSPPLLTAAAEERDGEEEWDVGLFSRCVEDAQPSRGCSRYLSILPLPLPLVSFQRSPKPTNQPTNALLVGSPGQRSIPTSNRSPPHP